MPEKKKARPRQNKRWTRKNRELLVKEYPDNETSRIAGKLGRTEHSVRNKASSLGLRKRK